MADLMALGDDHDELKRQIRSRSYLFRSKKSLPTQERNSAIADDPTHDIETRGSYLFRT